MSIFQGLVVTPDGLPPYWKHITHYREIQAIVGGSFDVFQVETEDGKTISVYCDDEGLYKGEPMNHLATMFRGYPILGTVLLAGGVDRDGEQLSLDPKVGEACITRVIHPSAQGPGARP